MSQALYRRYRPDAFADVVGQEHVTTPLMQALRSDKVNHAYLFSGPRGCGKTTSARILARCLNCAQGPTDTPCGECDSCVELARGGAGSVDVVEIDAASHNGVDDARELRERAAFAPARDRYKIFILDEAHMVTTQGFNALLKLVEEPPPHVRFIFATTEPDKVIGTIRSRTHHYPFRLVPPSVLTEYLETLCAQENVTVSSGVMPLVVRAGSGSVRDTLSVLDQLIAGSDAAGVTYERAIALLGFTDATLLDDAVDALAASDGASLFHVVDRIISTGHEPRRFVEDLLERLRDLLVLAASGQAGAGALGEVPEDQLERMQDQSRRLGLARASRAGDLVNDALTSMVGATSPRLHLELLCARLLAADASPAGVAVAAAPSAAPTAVPAGTAANQVQGAGHAGGAAQIDDGLTGAARAKAALAAARPPASEAQASAAQASQAQASAAPAAEQVTPGEPTRPAPWDDEPEDGATPATSTQPAEPAQAPTPAPAPSSAPDTPAAPPSPSAPWDEPEPVEPDPIEPMPYTAPTPVVKQAPAEAPAASAPAPTATPAPQEPAVPPAAPPAGSQAGGAEDAELLRRRWQEVLGTLERRRVTWSMVSQSAQVASVEAGVLTLAFDNAALAGRFGGSQHAENVALAVRETLGLQVRVEATTGPVATPTGPGIPATGAAPSYGQAPSHGAAQSADSASPYGSAQGSAPAYGASTAHVAGTAGLGSHAAAMPSTAAPAPAGSAASVPATGASAASAPAAASATAAADDYEEIISDDDEAAPDATLSGADVVAKMLGGQVVEE
ncbi:DNA polymerase III subunit gamma and tau [Demequina globuliformis]|uniref:DNA polymerase III subunit gamma and tau n=1 Tax=Demequina globuliformis TaxID=676202 RepID=UPI000780E854|nr:DNA polymerase III subunit gamma and tau [Demequina globuliformis]